MHVEATDTFIRLYKKLPSDIQERTDKTVHPSLGHKKMSGYEDLYEIRVSKNYRITYQKIDDVAYLRKIGTHNLLKNP